MGPAGNGSDRYARIAAIIVGIAGLVVVVIPAASNFAIGDDPFTPGEQTKKVITVAPDGKETIQTTTSPADPSLTERALGDGGLLLLRLGVVALAAFLAGAVVQRTTLARFEVKVGGVEIPGLIEATDDAMATITVTMDEQQEKIEGLQRDLATLTREVIRLHSGTGDPGAG